MGIFQLDLTIKTMIELGIEDMRTNPWLIDHMLQDCTDNQYLKDKYGKKQVDACKEWFANNQVDIYMRPRNDKDRMPCITITPGSSPEKGDMKHMADLSTEKIILMPNEIGKPIPYVVKPFVPAGYDQSTGIVGIDPNTKGLDVVTSGMILVNPENGTGYIIQDVTAAGIQIEVGIDLEAAQLAVVPQFPYYEARIEHSFFQESCDIGCYSHGDPQVCVWLHSIVLTALLRYRESLLEANGFAESMISSAPLIENPNYSGPDGEEGFVRTINLTGQVENTWIKSPRRFIEKVLLKERIPGGFTGGIKILSNLDSPPFINKEEETWHTVDEEEDQ